MTPIENQPVKFNLTADACRCEGIEYNQLVDVGDVTQFQIELEPCATESNIILNGAFNDSSNWATIGTGGYAFSNNQACASSNANVLLYQTGILTGGTLYYLEFTIDSIGTDCQLYVYFGYTNLITTITSSGTHIVTGFAFDDGLGSDLSDALIFITTNTDICLSNVSMFEMSTEMGFAIKDNNGDIVAAEWLNDYVYNIPASSSSTDIIGYTVDSDYFILGTDGKLTVKVNWADLGITDKGCYTINMLDQCNQNDTFATSFCDGSDWTEDLLVGTITTHAFQLQNDGDRHVICSYYVVGNGAASAMFISYNLWLFTTATLRVTYTVSGSNFEVYFGDGTNESTHRTVSGTYTEDFTAALPGVVGLQFRVGGAAAGAFTARIENIHVHIANDELTTQDESNNFKLDTYNCGTLLIQASGDSNLFGLNFDVNFMPSIRVEAQLDRAQYTSDRKVNESSIARFRNIYYQRYKKWRLYIHPVAEYVHDFLSLLLGYDHFYINGAEYIVVSDQEYLANYDGSDFEGSVSLEVMQKESLVRNQVCGAEGTGVLPPIIYLVDEATGTFILQAENNDDLIAENQ